MKKKIIGDRDNLLKQIDDLNKQLKFVGCRGEMYLTDDRLKELINKLKEKVNQKKKK
jgi:hypothetical protein